jgi:hypothetical protein
MPLTSLKTKSDEPRSDEPRSDEPRSDEPEAMNPTYSSPPIPTTLNPFLPKKVGKYISSARAGLRA